MEDAPSSSSLQRERQRGRGDVCSHPPRSQELFVARIGLDEASSQWGIILSLRVPSWSCLPPWSGADG